MSTPTPVRFTAFQLDNSCGELRRAVAQYPFMTDDDFIQAAEKIIAEQVPLNLKPEFGKRLVWLRQIAEEKE